MKRVISSLILLVIFLLPWQTRWIFAPTEVNGGYFEYGTQSLYGTELLLGLTLFLALIYLLPRVKKNTDRKNRFFYVALFCLIFIANCLLAISPLIALHKLTNLVLALSLFALLVVFKIPGKTLGWTITASAVLQALFAVKQFAEQSVVANKWLGLAAQNPQTLGVPVIETAAGRVLRAFGAFPHPNMLAGFLTIALLVIIALFLSADKPQEKKSLTMCFTIVNIGLLLTFSRAALIALAVGLIFLMLLTRQYLQANRAIAKFSLIALFVFVLFTVSFPELAITRLTAAGHAEQLSTATRLAQYADYWPLVKGNWLFGVGLGNYPTALILLNDSLPAWEYQPIHNAFLLIVAELGVAGVMLILAFWGWLFQQFKRAKKLPPAGQALLAAILVMAILGFFDHYFWSFWSGTAILAATAALFGKYRTS